MTERNRLTVRLTLWTVSAVAAVFSFDLLLPLGVAGGVPYVLAVFIALYVPRRGFVLAVAVLCSLLTLLGLLWSPASGGAEVWKVLTNRILAMFAIWVSAIFGLVWRRYHERQELSVTPSRPEQGAAERLPEFRYRRTLFLLSMLFVIAGSLLLWNQSNVQSDLVESTLIEDAKAYSEAMAMFRTLYASEVVEPARKMGIVVTHDYRSKDGAIPLPITLSMELGKQMGEQRGGIVSRLYSPYPFPWRQLEGGLTDDFAQQAWETLSRNPDKPFHRFEELHGHFVLRYASADLMRKSCINCHNTRPDSPKSNWKVGDVRGVLEVVVPMDHIKGAAASRSRQTAGVLAGLAAVAVCALALVIGRLNQASVELREQVQEQVAEIAAMHEMQGDMRAAGKIQEYMLPHEAPRVPGLDVAGVCRPATVVAGDCFDYICGADGSLYIVVADVAGHGMGPALIMAGGRRLLRTLVHTRESLGDILSLANQAFAEDAAPARFVTLFLARINTNRTLTYASAGHPSFLVDADGGVQTLDAAGIPLAVVPDATYATEGPIALETGQILLLLTDGAYETQSVDNSLFGLSRVLQVVREYRDTPAEQIAQALVEAIREFSHPNEPADDVTIVVVKIKSPST